jgi:hypothetical protein
VLLNLTRPGWIFSRTCRDLGATWPIPCSKAAVRTSLPKKLFTHSAVESESVRRYIPLITPTGIKRPTDNSRTNSYDKTRHQTIRGQK